MISNIMQEMLKGSSVIRAMFEEGQKMEKLYGKENVFDFSIFTQQFYENRDF